MTLGTERPEIACSLRSRKHFKSLIDKTTDLSDRYFLLRALYKDCFLDFNCMHIVMFAFTKLTVYFVSCQLRLTTFIKEFL